VSTLRKFAILTLVLILNWGLGFLLFKSYQAIQGSSSIAQSIQNSSNLLGAEDFPPTDLQIDWAEKVLEGGYILYFRHAEREKWNTVTVFDWIEVSKGLNGRDETFSRAVCLTEKGIEESKMLGMIFDDLAIPVSKVVASPSCRAQETAEFAFGQIADTWPSALHATAVNREQRVEFSKELKTLLEENAPNGKSNLVVVGHGNTLNYYEDEIFVEVDIADWAIDELGFYVLEKTEKGLVARLAYKNFSDFANSLLAY
jgi:phosphohistidine phosphatase SixA